MTELSETVLSRPGRADARRNFDAILAVARSCFAELGTTAPLEEIARRAGVGIGTLYRHFPTREALIESVYVEEVMAVSRAALDFADLEPWEALLAWLKRFVSYVGTKKVLVASLNKDSQTLISCRGVIYEAGGPLLKRAQEAGAVRTDAAIDDVVRLVSGIAGVGFVDDQQRDKVLAIALDGLRTR